MFNNAALDVVIGLVFIFLLYSLLGTLLQEIIATNVGLRGNILKTAIRRMLDDDAVETDDHLKKINRRIKNIRDIVNKIKMPSDSKAHINQLIDSSTEGVRKVLSQPRAAKAVTMRLSDAFYEHPLIKYLRADTLFIKKQPAYLSSDSFSKVVIDLLRGKDIRPGDGFRQAIQDSLSNEEIAWFPGVQIQGETLQYILSIWADAQGDVQRFKEQLEHWFNEMMDRTTGWYKKYTQYMLLGIGMIIAVAFNVDTVNLAIKLHKNPKLREELVAQAGGFLKDHARLDEEIAAQQKLVDSSPGAARSTAQANLDQLKNARTLRDSLTNQATSLVQNDITNVNTLLGLGWKHGFLSKEDMGPFFFLGWILTALAISMGAPFWFDLLNKLTKLRSSVAPKQKAATAASKDGSSNGSVRKIERVG